MSSYASLYLHGLEIFSWRYEVDPTFLFLFTNKDVRLWMEEPSEDNDHNPRQRVQLVAPAAVLRDRIEVLGISRSALNEAFDEYVKNRLQRLWGHWELREQIYQRIDKNLRTDIELNLRTEIELFEKITLTVWADFFSDAIKSPVKRQQNPRDPTSVHELLEVWRKLTHAFFSAQFC